MNEGIHLDLDTWIVPGQIRKANLCRGLRNRYTPAGTEVSRLRHLYLYPPTIDNRLVKQLLSATRVPGHVQPVGRPCGTWMHYATRHVKEMGLQMGYHSLEWNWPKEAMNRPIGAGIVDGAMLFHLLVIT